jgi:hypothetical protein
MIRNFRLSIERKRAKWYTDDLNSTSQKAQYLLPCRGQHWS